VATTINASATAGLVQTADTSTILQLQTGGVTAVTVDASQNVGVGNASPALKLDVNGSIKMSGGTGTALTWDTAIGSQYLKYDSTFNGMILAGYSGVGFRVFGSGTNAATLDSSGNLGLGVTPSAWNSAFRALQVKNASLWSTGNDASLTANAYFDGANYRYIGNAGATRQYHNTDGTIAWSQAASGTAGNTISFTQAMTLDASGNLGIGTTSPASFGAICTRRGISVAGVTGSVSGSFSDGANDTLSISHDSSLSRLTFAALTFNTGTTERARIDSSGNMQIAGTTSRGRLTLYQNSGTNADTVALVAATSSGGGSQVGLNLCNSSGANKGYFYYDVGSDRIFTIVGSAGVYLSNGGTSWTSNSDERMKDIIEPISDAANKVSSLRAVIGKFKKDAEDTRRSFLIAQDVLAVFPEAVDVPAEGATDTNGDPSMMGVRYTDMVPLLVAAIKEQQTLITQLQADVAALKGASA